MSTSYSKSQIEQATKFVIKNVAKITKDNKSELLNMICVRIHKTNIQKKNDGVLIPMKYIPLDLLIQLEQKIKTQMENNKTQMFSIA